MNSQNHTPQRGNSRLERLTEQFGRNVVFVPVYRGKKNPMVTGYTEFTIEKMGDAEYCRKLEEGNIAVLLGPNSGNLISVDFDDEMAFKKFARVNPELCKTLQSFGARGRNLWFIMTSEYTETTVKLKNENDDEVGEWRGGGGITIVDGTHPGGMDYQIDDSFPIRAISADDISWPEEWRKYPGRRDAFEILKAGYGPPILVGASGGVQLNESFVVGLMAAELEIAYAKELRQFVQYSEKEGIWKGLSDQQVEGLIAQYIARLAGECSQKALHFKKRNTVIRSIRIQLEAETFRTFIRPIPWNGWHRIAVENCALGIIPASPDHPSEIHELPFSPAFHFLGKSEVAYREFAECPRFLGELLGPVLDPDDLLLLQKMFGLILVMRNELQKVLLLEGPADLGKGVAARLLDAILGKSLVTELRTRHLDNRFEMSRYVGKRLLAGRDVPSDFLRTPGASALKKLTGGDLLSSESKNTDGFEDLKGDYHVVITSNSPLLLRVDDDSTAWERRLVIIPFRAPQDGLRQRIPNFEKVLLEEEGSGILNWLLEGAKLALTDVYECGTVRLTPTQKARVRQRVRVSDTVDFFVEEGLVLSPGNDISSQQLFDAYEIFCATKGLSAESDRVFRVRVKNLIENRFEGKVTYSENIGRAGDRSRGYRGIALLKP